MKAPLFLVEDGSDVTVFQSAGDAELYIEPVDARSGIYRLFDCEGHEIGIEVRPGSPRESLLGEVLRSLEPERIALVEIENAPAQRELLAEHLRQHLAHCKSRTGESVQSMSFDELVAAASRT
jgi:hypothetical protein